MMKSKQITRALIEFRPENDGALAAHWATIGLRRGVAGADTLAHGSNNMCTHAVPSATNESCYNMADVNKKCLKVHFKSDDLQTFKVSFLKIFEKKIHSDSGHFLLLKRI